MNSTVNNTKNNDSNSGSSSGRKRKRKRIVYVVLGKQDEAENPFFQEVHQGCDEAASRLSSSNGNVAAVALDGTAAVTITAATQEEEEEEEVVCDFHVPPQTQASVQIELLRSLLSNYTSSTANGQNGKEQREEDADDVVLGGIAIAPLTDNPEMANLI